MHTKECKRGHRYSPCLQTIRLSILFYFSARTHSKLFFLSLSLFFNQPVDATLHHSLLLVLPCSLCVTPFTFHQFYSTSDLLTSTLSYSKTQINYRYIYFLASIRSLSLSLSSFSCQFACIVTTWTRCLLIIIAWHHDYLSHLPRVSYHELRAFILLTFTQLSLSLSPHQSL